MRELRTRLRLSLCAGSGSGSLFVSERSEAGQRLAAPAPRRGSSGEPKTLYHQRGSRANDLGKRYILTPCEGIHNDYLQETYGVFLRISMFHIT